MGAGLLSDIANTGTELFLTKGVPYLGKKAVEMGRYYGSELMRDPKLQQRAINYALNKANPLLHKVGSEALDQLSTKIRPKKKYTTNRKDLDGSGVFSDLFGMTKKVSDVTGKIIGGPTKKTLDDWWSGDLAKRAFSPKTGIFSGHSGFSSVLPSGEVVDLKMGVLNGRPWMFRKDNGQPFGPAFKGGSLDIHKAIGKLPKPKGGWTLPGHHYTGPYNDLENQLKYDPKTGQILEIYDMPTGKTDAIAMQHDVDYSVCKDDRKCKNKADRKMVQALDNVPYNERQWGHWLARNVINTKQKLGLRVPKNGKSRRVKKTGKKN